MTDNTIYHAIVGCGRVAANHADGFQKIPQVKLLYACDILESNAITLAKTFQIEKITTAYEEVLADPQVTSVSLAVPHHLHASMTLQAIAQGKHVLVEKPFVIQPEEGREILEALQQQPVIVMPVTQHRFDPIIRLSGQLVHGGELGKLVMVRGHLECVRSKDYYRESPWRGEWSTEGGSVLINQAYHLVDLLLWLGGTPDKIKAHVANLANTDVMETEDSVCAAFTFTNGALGSLSICGAAGAQWKSSIELLGTQGVLAFNIDYPNVLLRLHLNDRKSLKQWRKRFEECQQALSPPLPPGIGYYGVSHQDQAKAFVEAIQGNPPAIGANLSQALNVITFIQDIYQQHALV